VATRCISTPGEPQPHNTVAQSRPRPSLSAAIAAIHKQMFSGFAPLREDDDVVAFTRVRSIG